MSAVLTPEQLAALQTALGTLADLPDGVEIRAYVTAGTEGQTDPPGKDYLIALRVERNATPPPPPEPPPVVSTTLWAIGMAKNVRDAPAGAIVGSLAQNDSVDVDMTTAQVIGVNQWVKIVSVNFAGKWIAANVLSPSRP